MNTRSIRFRLVIWYAGLLTVVFVVFGVFMYLAMDHFLEASVGDSQRRRADIIAQTLISQVSQTGEEYVRNEISTSYDPELNERFIRVTRPNGTVLYVSGEPRENSFDPKAVPVLKPKQFTSRTRKQRLPDGQDLLIISTAYSPPRGQTYLVECGIPLGPIQAMQDELVVALMIGLPLVVAVAVAGGYVLVGKALAPVDKISRSAEQITLHNLRERLPIAQTGDELERLSSSLNHMITRLDEAFQHNRRFMADASHELRTPLTIVRGELEAVLPQTSHLPEIQEKIGTILEEVVRITKIVESLFAISRLDAGEAQAEWVKFDLAQLAATTADQMLLLAEDKGISVTSNAAQPVLVDGDRARIKQVVVNLLDNAIKYTPAGGTVCLNVTANGKTATLEVADNGAGIPASALPHVFERFFRVDPARSREVGGAGIGLSIVKSICTAHGGQVAVQSEAGKGSRFRVELPLARSGGEKEAALPDKTNIRTL